VSKNRKDVQATAEHSPALEYQSTDTHPIRARPGYVLPHDDPERLGALLADLEPRLTAVACRFTRDPDRARDVVQSAFEKVVRHGWRFQGNARVSTWIHRIVANEALMWLRSERRRSDLQRESVDGDTVTIADPTPSAPDLLDHRRQVSRLHEAIAQLCREERDVIEHCALAGLSYAEYATNAGVHPAAVKSRAFRARRHLARTLEN
jgi:RNA polymerase sigma-70 factor (ECF subfamily)